MSATVTCPECGGSGVCVRCGGSGGGDSAAAECRGCKGAGDCARCEGEGTLIEDPTFPASEEQTQREVP